MPPTKRAPKLGSLSCTRVAAGPVTSVIFCISSAVRVRRCTRRAMGRSLDSTRSRLSGARAIQAAAGKERA